ncbi:YfhO family protein [Planococcus sp. CP5-4]|uniref:YfhO family protein n=1 Tax=unclassified Planococcus (in: firmicutes) TaxID=2662419 RepID=UPI001C21994F|nr:MULTISPECIES: YfhO family protein [unclassified Planococcus (in: firmicutes)]MBU9673179.1 YfhO family protein [Planococcus sp. CP5-4_YE]MBW6062487.1 YfhO family protein [Planococcus sp. CP5-4]
MRSFRPYLLLTVAFLAMAIIGHGVFLFQWTQNQFMAGPNDGLAQMMPFKQLLYEQYTHGEFFYSFDFGLGAGIFSELSYYFSTSFVYIATLVIVYLFDIVGLIGDPDVLFWANASVFISIARLTIVLIVTYTLFRYMRITRLSAFVGASIYGISGMYFRHAAFWEFFADAFIWLPLLIFGAEKIFREQKPSWFMFAIAISMIDNFYFAYINFLLVGIYILFRLFIPLEKTETKWKKSIVLFLTAGLIGAGISMVSFIPSVYAFLNNHRPAFQQDILWFEETENILFMSRYILLPAMFMLFLFIPSLYKLQRFRLFALIGIVTIMLYHSPMVGSIFNGFSAPQHRWEYFISLAAAGAIASGLDRFHKLHLKEVVPAAILTALFYGWFSWRDEALEFTTLYPRLAVAGLVLTLAATLAALAIRQQLQKPLLAAVLLALVLTTANVYQSEKLLDNADVADVDEALITGENYDNEEVHALIDEIQERETSEMYRIDWMEGVRNNTPIVQDFQGLSAYSSLLNKNLLYFYLYDLEIDMQRESVSRYATLGNRSNLHSLLQGNYAIRTKDDPNVPFGFRKFAATENFIAYQNRYPLPFARPAFQVYQESQLTDEPPLLREHAMLSGIVLDETAETEPLPDRFPGEADYEIEEMGASYEDGVLDISQETGGIDLLLNEVPEEGDLYISFHLENMATDQGFPLEINEYRTTRKSNQSIYKTFVDDLTIRVEAAQKIQIRMPEGTYKLTDIEIVKEPYTLLREQNALADRTSNLEIDGSRVDVAYDNQEGAPFLNLSIPYERGWQAAINGEPVDVLKANYAFLAVPLKDGMNEIELRYHPPFFLSSLFISLLSLATGLFWLRKRKRNSTHKHEPKDTMTN